MFCTEHREITLDLVEIMLQEIGVNDRFEKVHFAIEVSLNCFEEVRPLMGHREDDAHRQKKREHGKEHGKRAHALEPVVTLHDRAPLIQVLSQ
jgi:hypothetical protein